MAYSKPNTFVGGNVISSSGLNENLKALQDYHNTGVVAGDIQTSSKTLDTNSIMPGRYSSVSNTMYFVSGFQGFHLSSNRRESGAAYRARSGGVCL